MKWLEIFARKRTPHNYFMDLYGNELPYHFLPKVQEPDESYIILEDDSDTQ